MPTIKISNFPAFTLIELMISISIIAILTAAAIPSFSDFSKSQTLNQNSKTLKSDLRIAQSRSISGSTFGTGSSAKAWGIYFSTATNKRYTVFACNPAVNLSQYSGYTYGGSQCPTAPSDTSTVKTVNLGSQVTVVSLIPSSPLSLVFDSQNGAAYANGLPLGSNASITLSNGTSSAVTTITPGGGISD